MIPKPKDGDLVFGEKDLAEVQVIRETKQKENHEAIRHFKDGYNPKEDRLDLNSKQEMHEYFEITEKSRRLGMERSEKINGMIPTTVLYDRDGRPQTFRGIVKDAWGLREKIRWGRPSYRLTETQLKRRIAEENERNARRD